MSDTFDTLLTQTDDLAAVRMIERLLEAKSIPFEHTHVQTMHGRRIELRIKASDAAAAGQISGEAFARRAKMKAMPAKKKDFDQLVERDTPHIPPY